MRDFFIQFITYSLSSLSDSKNYFSVSQEFINAHPFLKSIAVSTVDLSNPGAGTTEFVPLYESSFGISILLFLVVSLIVVVLLFSKYNTAKHSNEKLQLSLDKSEIQRKTLEQKNLEKDNMMSILVHDLRSPLSGIKGLNQLLRSEGNFSDFQNELLQTADSALDSSLKLINDILIIKKIEESDEELIMNEIDPKELISNLATSFQPALLKKKQKIKLDFQSDEILITNHEYLRSILENILSNAIKYSDFEKIITISYSLSDNFHLFSIQDEGPGILPDEQHLLFKKFQKLSPRPTANESSSGLGLYIVKFFVEKLNGRIQVKSEPNIGSTFTVKIPKMKIE